MVRKIASNIIDLSNEEIEESLANEIKDAIAELEGARKYFNEVYDPELVDYAIYNENSATERLSYLIRKAKFQIQYISKI